MQSNIRNIKANDIQYVFAHKSLVVTELILVFKNGTALKIEATPQAIEELHSFNIRAIEEL